MNWTVLEGTADLHALEAASGDRGFLVFKHSTRCPVSSQAALSLQRWEAPAGTPPMYLVYVVEDRALSMSMADRWEVRHESPQLLWWLNGKIQHHTSHFEVRGTTISAWMDQTNAPNLG